ncbi:MAG: hypothetical protein MZU97_02410 [Bacillus subtilis]|nr:hypothetical protein [Bacillus subtilis]
MVSSLKTSSYNKNKQYEVPNHIVKGAFPRHENNRELVLYKFNRFLSFTLLLTIAASMISYSLVVSKESALAQIHNDTNDINLENIELQNKVDYVKSFSNINNKMAKANFPKKPETVIEIKESAIAPVVEKSVKNNIEVRPVSGY